MINFFFYKKKIPSDIRKWSFSRFSDRTWDPFRESTIFFSQNLTCTVFWGEIYRELRCGWNHYIIISGSRSKVEITRKNSPFSNFDCDAEIMMKWLQHHGNLQWISPQRTLLSTFFSTKKKNSVRHPKMVVSRFWDRNGDPFWESKNFFSQNLTYSYSFLGWNSPGITMSLESLHNYFVITVKSRKNYEKVGFFNFCLWSRNNVGIIATLW